MFSLRRNNSQAPPNCTLRSWVIFTGHTLLCEDLLYVQRGSIEFGVWRAQRSVYIKQAEESEMALIGVIGEFIHCI